ncbi:DUF2834 domain-containing protein [Agrococcus sp. SGAir0287]|uniref:DUF2834 domain-containing protein n=1 Tax=Agrococcus sp. SGAir0287 TaxID=2070347 RepID=UPI0010CCEB14|nr:DUF2834 domain-containing protein [Agrococcus sp. SGAir0287]QCR19797.1 hypothetical protein C1N71_10455 [Agrococcus sp. SGAir0287]
MQHRVLAAVLLVLAAVGAVGTGIHNLAYFGSADASVAGYLEGWFVNAASSSAAVDLLVVASAASIVILVEGARMGWARWAWVLVVLGGLVAIAFAFPLFLALRELALDRRERATARSDA